MSNETRMNVIKYHESLINDYLSRRNSICCRGSIEKYASEQKNLIDAIKVAVRSEFKDGKKHPHQFHIKKYVYKEFLDNLLNVIEKIKNCKSFDDLLYLIEKNSPSGAGELFCYDVSLRICYYKKLLPEKIYIHSGTRKGLEKLMSMKIYEKSISKYKLPEPFNMCELSNDQLEDFLCIYKEQICGVDEKFSYTINKPSPQGCL